MGMVVSLLCVYLFACAAWPVMVARRRGLSARQAACIAAIGALTGWTIFGAIAAWLFALFDDPLDSCISR